MTPDEFAEIARKRLIVFMSVDMEGSTRLKQAIAYRDAERWLKIILRFTEDFPQAFQAKREELSQSLGREIPKPELWKMLGDEMVFRAEPKHLHDVTALVETFQAAIAKLNARTRHDKDAFPLLKGTAWTAGFPVTNAVVRIDGGKEDFLGPSMDAGFRIAKLASPHRFAISVELGWLLTHLDARAKVNVHFEGCEELKGVAEESGYPAIWLEMESSEYKRLEDELLGRSAQSDVKKTHNLCGAFIQEYGVPDYLPFLPDSSQVSPPLDYTERYGLAIESLRRLYLVDDPDARATQTQDQADEVAKSLRDHLGGNTG